MDVARTVPAILRTHPCVTVVELVGSRAEQRAHELSDWDFAVETDAFERLARDLHALVAPLSPLAEQWDPYSAYACYMLMLPGPTKIDLMFPDEQRAWSPPWSPSPETLEAIDRHFWDWILWLEQKRRGGHAETLAKSLSDMYERMLSPMGVSDEPASIVDALNAYVEARDDLERKFRVSVPRDLEHEVRPVVSPRWRPETPE